MSSSQSATATPDSNNSPSTKATDQLSAQNASSRSGTSDSTAPKLNPVVNGLQPESMTTATTTSASSPASDAIPQNTTAPSATGAVPYGTRSRNRVGGARPNYAEDRDIDTEYELVASMSRSGSSKRPPSNNRGATSPSTDNDRATGVNTRRHATTNGSNTAPQTKESIPGTSSFSANPSSNSYTATKKRKQPGSHHSTPASSTPNTTSLSSTKKFIAPANVSTEYQKTHVQNMLTFNNCQAYLKQGKLKADDGTILGPNGT